MDRKNFIRTCSMACLSGSAIVALLQSCASTNYFAQTSLNNNQLVIKKSEFLLVEKSKQVERKYVLLKTVKYNFPICVYKTGEENYFALLMECTHKGCELQPHGDHLICPCHGSEFSNKGVVQNPPAEENLKAFQITTDHENIYVHL